MELTIRAARAEDASALLAIYAPYVRDTAITFEYEIPSPETFRQRILHTLERYPYLAAETEDGKLLGYAYASPFQSRASCAARAILSRIPGAASRARISTRP